MFAFESFCKLLANGAKIVEFDQCMFGGPTKKPTQILYGNCPEMASLERYCNHPSVQQTDARTGRTYYAPHPTYVGVRDEQGNYKTAELAAYPADLNASLMWRIHEQVHGHK